MTRQEAIAITAHEELLAAAMEMRGLLARMSGPIRTYAQQVYDKKDIDRAIKNADRALAMAGFTFDYKTGVARYVA
jgi:hypothetical protein